MINNTDKSRAFPSILLSFPSLVYPTTTGADLLSSLSENWAPLSPPSSSPKACCGMAQIQNLKYKVLYNIRDPDSPNYLSLTTVLLCFNREPDLHFMRQLLPQPTFLLHLSIHYSSTLHSPPSNEPHWRRVLCGGSLNRQLLSMRAARLFSYSRLTHILAHREPIRRVQDSNTAETCLVFLISNVQ